MTENNPEPTRPFDLSRAQEENGLWAAWTLLGLAIAAVITLVAVALTSVNDSDVGQGVATASHESSGSALQGQTVRQEMTITDGAVTPHTVVVHTGDKLLLTLNNDSSSTVHLDLGTQASEDIEPKGTQYFEVGTVERSQSGWLVANGKRDLSRTIAIEVSAENSSAGENSADYQAELLDRLQNPSEHFTPVDPILQPANNETTHKVEMDVSVGVLEIAAGTRQQRYLINGKMPGPVLHGKPGDTFEFTVKNNSDREFKLSVHGVDSSGIPSVEPGTQVTKSMKFDKPGMWLYHGGGTTRQMDIANGLVGAVVIDPPEAPQVDTQLAMIASEIYLGPEGAGASELNILNGKSDLASFNGIPNQYDYSPIQLKVGEKVRLWIANAGPDNYLSLTTYGTTFDSTYSGGRMTGGEFRGTLALLSGQAGFIDFTFDEPGTYEFENQQMTMAYRGQHGKFEVR